MSSQILLISPPDRLKAEFGDQSAHTLENALTRLHEQSWGGVALFTAELTADAVEKILGFMQEQGQTPALVLIVKTLENADVWNWIQKMTPLRLVQASDEASIRQALEALIEHSLLQEQEEQRRKLVVDQNQSLQKLNRDLETRVERRRRTLENARARLVIANQHTETLHAASLAIHRARSLGELENSLYDALKLHLHVSAIRIRFQSQSAHLPQDQNFVFCEPLTLSGQAIGEFTVFAEKNFPFRESDLELLHQIAATAALGVDRLGKLEQAEVLKQQWQATFDSISEPLCLTDSQFQILRTNREYTQVSGKSFNQVLNKNCFSEFFDSKTALDLNNLGRSFKTKKSRWQNEEHHTFEVSAQPLNFEALQGEVLLVLFRDVSSRLQIERQLLESSKMAELGLIGSSIAHELNNPLGGMLSFIQLIRMGLQGNENYAADIAAMETAAQRCREIVQRLLGFARKSDTRDRQMVDLRDVLKDALEISELQTRSQGIVVDVHWPTTPYPLAAQSNQLSQALCNLVQNSAEAILEKRRQNPREMGKIEINFSQPGPGFQLEIHDTGIGIAPEVQDKIFNPLFSTKSSGVNSGLGLTMAYKIISEHGGKLEISSQSGVGTTARIAFQSLDLKVKSQVFDSKI